MPVRSRYGSKPGRRNHQMGDTRQARIQRRTTETDIDLTFVVDGAGASSINTGVGFFDQQPNGVAYLIVTDQHKVV